MVRTEDRGADRRRLGSSVAGEQRAQVFLSWQSRAEGYRLLPLEAGGMTNHARSGWRSSYRAPTSATIGRGRRRPSIRARFLATNPQSACGRALVVHFWGVTCGPCRAEMPQWGRFLNERAGSASRHRSTPTSCPTRQRGAEPCWTQSGLAAPPTTGCSQTTSSSAFATKSIRSGRAKFP